MAKKKKSGGMLANAMKFTRTIARVSAKGVFTSAGLLIMTAPLYRGLAFATAASTSPQQTLGNLTNAGQAILADTTGIQPGVAGASPNLTTIFSTVVTVAAGVGLIIVGNKAVKRI